MKKVTIVIPCYNAEKYIAQCLDSIVGQTYPELEIFCINDGSKDQTLQILRDYQKTDARIKIIDQDNKGLSYTRTRSIREATGEFILFVDNDDWIDLNTVEEILKMDNGEDVFIFSYVREFSNASVPKDLKISGSVPAHEIQQKIVGLVKAEVKNVENIDSLVTVWGKMYRNKEYLKNLEFVSLQEIGTWDDGIFNLQVLQHADRVAIVNKPFYHYRKNNSNSITALYKENLPERWKNKYRWILKYLTEHHKPPVFFEALHNRISITFLGLCLNEMYNKEGSETQYINIRKILNDGFYRKELEGFQLKYLPFHWKIFYYLVKRRCTPGVFIMAKAIHAIINKHNR